MELLSAPNLTRLIIKLGRPSPLHRHSILSEPEPELVFCDLKCEGKAPLIRASEVALPLRKPSADALGLGREEGGERRPTV